MARKNATKAKKKSRANRQAEHALDMLWYWAEYLPGDPQTIVANAPEVGLFEIIAHVNAVKSWLDRLAWAATQKAKLDAVTGGAEIIEFPTEGRCEPSCPTHEKGAGSNRRPRSSVYFRRSTQLTSIAAKINSTSQTHADGGGYDRLDPRIRRAVPRART